MKHVMILDTSLLYYKSRNITHVNKSSNTLKKKQQILAVL